ncbi:MAG TPA: carbon monoxide dehydrogenase maturation protein [Myxococcota bacterium]|nr:carbon monoxide dehydrogenase maturation protein [Myxococcota bacterium]
MSSALIKTKVVAVLGKGGAGKTMFSALAARSLIDMEIGPLLLVDADPTGGLAWAVGAGMERTIGQVREEMIREATSADMDAERVAQAVDWSMLQALQERGNYSLLSMGMTDSKGCFCPLNTLLRAAIEKLAVGFAVVLIDAEAGIEQISRQLMRGIDIPVVVTDGSARGLKAAGVVAGLLIHHRVAARGSLVLNRAGKLPGAVPAGLELVGSVPEDEAITRADGRGDSLLEIPSESRALGAVRGIVEKLFSEGDR